jgi:hypothetical protein
VFVRQKLPLLASPITVAADLPARRLLWATTGAFAFAFGEDRGDWLK